MIKCVGCYNLLREEFELGSKQIVAYNCPRFFPYACAPSGLPHPGKGIIEAVKDCPEHTGEHCILCTKPGVRTYGYPPIAFACREHDVAWGKWLDDHPERRAYLSPIGRLRLKRANWIEVFREFIEAMRAQSRS